VPGVEIDRQNARCPGNRDQIGDQLGGNRCAGAGLAILPGIAEIGHHSRDPLGRRAPQRIDTDQQLHQIVVCRCRCRLQHEHILAAHILVNFDKNLFVGKAPDRGRCQRDFQIAGNLFGKPRIAVSGQQLHSHVPFDRQLEQVSC